MPTNPLENAPSSSPEELAKAQYEVALAAAKALHAAGAPNPLDDENERVQAAQDVIDAWEAQAKLIERGVGTMEKARLLVRAARIWVDAGFRDANVIRAAITRLTDEHADAAREGNDEITGYLKSAIDELDALLARPKETPREILNAKLSEAEAFMTAGTPDQAIAVLTLTLFDPRFARLGPAYKTDVRARIAKIREGK